MNRRPRVLVVDDEQAISLAVSFRLRSEGYDVEAVTLGKDGLDAAARRPPDVILLDRRLPDADGLQMLTRFQGCAATQDVPIVIMSGSEGDELLALAAGAAGYITKPFLGQQLVNLVKSVTVCSPSAEMR